MKGVFFEAMDGYGNSFFCGTYCNGLVLAAVAGCCLDALVLGNHRLLYVSTLII